MHKQEPLTLKLALKFNLNIKKLANKIKTEKTIWYFKDFHLYYCIKTIKLCNFSFLLSPEKKTQAASSNIKT